ncbi:MAG: hypothetical protein ACLP6G_06730 [Terriglobales bacterium]
MARFWVAVSLTLAVLVSLFPSHLHAQLPYPVVDSETYATAGTGAVKFIGYGIAYHTMSWTAGGTGCTVQLEGSSTSSFSSYVVIGAANVSCVSASSETISTPTPSQWIRVHVNGTPTCIGVGR